LQDEREGVIKLQYMLTLVSVFNLYNFIRHIGSRHVQHKKNQYTANNMMKKVNNSVTIFNNAFELVT